MFIWYVGYQDNKISGFDQTKHFCLPGKSFWNSKVPQTSSKVVVPQKVEEKIPTLKKINWFKVVGSNYDSETHPLMGYIIIKRISKMGNGKYYK